MKTFQPNNENFYRATGISLDAVVYDIVLLQSTLIESKEKISKDYGIVLRFKIEGLWNIISDLYQFLPGKLKSKKLQDNYDRAKAYNETLIQNFI